MRVRAVVTACALLLLPGLPSAASEQLGPGAQVRVPGGGACTLNFVFRGTGSDLYIGTAGHCVASTGVLVVDTAGVGFGTVVYRHASLVDHPYVDLAIIEVDEQRRGDVTAAVRRWGGPTGVTGTTDARPGDLLLQYGYGGGFETTEQTRQRIGILNGYSSELFQGPPRSFGTTMPVWAGDSGSPVIQAESGKALGYMIGAPSYLPPGTGVGITLDYALETLAHAGWSLTLVEAPFEPPL